MRSVVLAARGALDRGAGRAVARWARRAISRPLGLCLMLLAVVSRPFGFTLPARLDGLLACA